ncbi:MAG TPA: glycosyltransferase family 4 protein [Candidatus Bathyarchaeia archaeon]|nr:glycosyltransferase family 4 protein [Candidatus Bathyarchaeia archaeon]
MAAKRLCIITHTFLPHVGGIERVVYEQGKRLMQRGFDVTVLTSRMHTAKSYVIDGIRVRCYDSLNAAFGLGIPYPVPQINSFKTFLKCVNASDLVHVHGHPYLSSLYAAKLAKFYEKPVVLTQHNTFIAYAGGFWDHVEWLNDAAVGKQVLKNADRIITVSTATKRYVLSLGADPARMSVLHNGVDVDRFKPLKTLREEKRRKLGIPTKATVILTVRRLVYKNGIDTLIETATTAIKQNPNLIFLVVGTGPDQTQIQTQAKQLGISRNFRLMGFVSDEELPSFYNAADLFVLPSKSGEGLPLVSLEAMACGLPVIATDVGGIREIIPEGYGKFVPPDSPDTMAEAVIEFSQVNLQPLKQKLRTRVEDRFSWEKNVEQLAQIYEQLI